MNKLLTSLLMLLPLLLLPLNSHADKDKGPSDRAYERANDNASFKRDRDWKNDKNHKGRKQDRKQHDRDDDDHKDRNKDRKGDKNSSRFDHDW